MTSHQGPGETGLAQPTQSEIDDWEAKPAFNGFPRNRNSWRRRVSMESLQRRWAKKNRPPTLMGRVST